MKHLTIHAVVLSAILSSAVMAETETLSTDTMATDTSSTTTTEMTTEMSVEMSTEAATIESMASSEGSTVVVEKLSSDYNQLLGDNSETVINGLRKGEEFTLSATTEIDGVQVTETATIASPAGKMGYGNVSHTLALTEYQLTQLGITDPTVLELEAALLGGSVTLSSGEVIEMKGVLALRSEGMGWGQIAQQYDTKLGHVISAVKSGRPIPVSTSDSTAAVTTTTASSSHGKASHITTASNGKAGGHGYKYGQGITTATGGSIGAGHANVSHANKGGAKAYHTNASSGHAYGGGIVSASGASVSGNAAHGGGSNAGGKGNGRGHSK
jgi:hypothetical protein